MNAKVLIVDDSLTVRMDLRDALHDAGFSCQECATLSAARAALLAAMPDAVILDVLLPDGDGLELLDSLRASPNGAACPVLILSSETELPDRVRGLSQGAEEYVGKPYDRHYVVARTRELLRGRRRPRDAQAPATVLVVDDSATFRGHLAERLAEAGYQVLQAASGEDGLRVAASERPKALLIDSVLPGLDGPGVIRRLRLDAALRAMPCILMTAADEQDAELRALDAGADAFVRKQDDLDMVVARLAAVLRSASTAAPTEQLGSLSGPKRLLAIDDSETYLAATADALREEGFDVMTASSGEQAIELLAVQNVDCILLDLIMPGMGGRETCQRIKTAPRFRDIPLIMLTGVESRSAMLEALEFGADDYVQKSGEFEVLKARVRAQLRRKQFEEDNRRIREELLAREKEAAEARAARELAQSRATLLAELSETNEALELRNKELASANSAKTEFLSTMSHELRTPLNAVIGFSEILIEGSDNPLSPRQIEYLGHINSSGQHLLSLINDILDLAKIEAGKFEIELAPLNLDSLLSDAVAIVSERAFTRKIRLERQCCELSVPVQVDGRRLKQIVFNLLTNAIKFTPDGGRVDFVVTVVERQQARDDLPGFETGLRMPLPDNEFSHFLQFCVRDSGIGISEADLQALFKPFSQIKNDVTRAVEGTGLGLVTVARLVDLHGGTVAVSSQPGQGSCFTFWLPWRSTRGPVQAVSSHAGPLRMTPMALVIEDDAAAAALMREQLQSAGFSVRHAASAEAALQMIPVCQPDLITLDVCLPGMDGWDFLGRVKTLTAWAEIPVVVVSVDAQHEVGLSLGAAAVLQKPINGSGLARELASLGFQTSANASVMVLLIHDGPTDSSVADVCANQPGCKLLRARGGREGIDLARRYLPDLVVLDLLVPDVGGVGVIEALMRDEQTARIPVVVLASQQLTDAERELLNSHVQRVIDQGEQWPQRFIGEVHRAFARHARLNLGMPLPMGWPGARARVPAASRPLPE